MSNTATPCGAAQVEDQLGAYEKALRYRSSFLPLAGSSLLIQH
ncbi:hypothetical protein [Coxiella-like endosymbiont]|nr:hypothetical protein [Coxiella-like endosymbiont]